MVYCSFFFKQKPAYEMRISDWSSDVCSSDLHRRHRRLQYRDRQRQALHATEQPDTEHDRRNQRELVEKTKPHGADLITPEMQEIGRASCRESVCQYV